jgi:hypothetical protein
MRISCADLQRIATLLLEHLENMGNHELEVGKDFYWEVRQADRYDRYEMPSELSVGQLSEDWQLLQEILSGKSEPLGYGLVWLSSILRVAGEEAPE